MTLRISRSVSGLTIALLAFTSTRRALAEPAAPPADASARRGHCNDLEIAPPPIGRYSRGEAVGLGLFSAFFGMGAFVVDDLPAPLIFGQRHYYFYGASLAASGPLAIVSGGDAAEVAGLTLAGTGGSIAARHEYAVAPASRSYSSSLGGFADLFVAHQGLYAAYATYRDVRVLGSSESWRDDWTPRSAAELIVAPLHPSNLNHPVSIATLATLAPVEAIALAGAYARGGVLPSDAGINVALGIPLAFVAGVTEEAIFRGFFYEELKLSLGRWPARAIDSTLFSLFHVPGELGVETATQIDVGLVTRFGTSILLEIAYDQGGLLESVALHTTIDVLALTVSALSPSNPLQTLGEPRVSARPTSGPPMIVPLWSGAF